MIQTSIVNKSELYYIFAEGLKKPSVDWVNWYNDSGRDTLITLLYAVHPQLGNEVDASLPKQLDFEKLHRLNVDSFQVPGPQLVVPAESIFKKWTDRRSGSPLSSSEGYLMGDSAVHMKFIFKELGIEIPEDFQLKPDHLILQLELLGMLEENGNQNFIDHFVIEHLDWTNHLLVECEKKEWTGFYYEWIKMIHSFFKNRCWEC